jgi:hypothetical protein
MYLISLDTKVSQGLYDITAILEAKVQSCTMFGAAAGKIENKVSRR